MSIRVLIADDHKIMRDGLRALIEQERDIAVVAEASDGREAVAFAQQLQPDVVVMDISMPDLNGIDATRRIKEVAPAIGVVALSMHSERRVVTEMLKAGAQGFLLKEGAFEELADAIRAVHGGECFMSGRIGNLVAEAAWSQRGQARGALTTREREVLQLIAEGLTNKDIARKLDISIKTVETHRTQLTRKTGMQNAADLTRYAIRERIISVT